MVFSKIYSFDPYLFISRRKRMHYEFFGMIILSQPKFEATKTYFSLIKLFERDFGKVHGNPKKHLRRS